jgi:Bacterial type II/III secretion system short domain
MARSTFRLRVRRTGSRQSRRAPANGSTVKKLFLFAATLLLFFAPLLAAAEELSVKVFVLRYRRVEEAALLIRGHLSDAASVTLTQRLNAMTVTDREENLKTVAKVLADFDVPPRGFTFAVKLVRARADVPAGSISQEIGGLGAKLKSLFQFNDYTLIDSAVLRGVEGRRVECRLGEEYNLSFGIGPTGAGGDDLVLGGFTLARLRKNEQGRTALMTLYRAPMPITINQTLVVGASREERSKSALILILLAQELSRSEVEKGAADARTVERHP